MIRRHRPLLISTLLAAVAVLGSSLQLACSSGSSSASAPAGPAVAAPSALGYATNPAVYPRNAAIAENAPHSSGGAVATYSVAPTLPAGLSLNTTTGVLSGTPTAITPQATYSVTAANGGGSTTCALVITVTEAPPSQLAYGTPVAVYTKGAAIAANAPTSSGGAATGYSATPALPSGLSLDATTGLISGTPTTVVARAPYTITALNAGGSTACTVEITVQDLPPTDLAYAANPLSGFLGAPITPDVPSNLGGTPTTYRVVPTLPAGLLLDAATGLIYGTPTVTASGTYRVTATNSGGSTACDLALTVIAPAPANLAYAVNPLVGTKGLALTPDQPSHTGGPILSYAVAPALPAGVSLDPLTGIISGTPTAITPTATYVVTATNTGGSTAANLTFTVMDQAPSDLVYATNPSSYTVGLAIQPNVPSHGGGAITGYSVSPALPAGLALDPATGVISGTPTALTAQATYVITGANATGSTPCAFVTSVVGTPIAPPATPVVTTVTYATAGKALYSASTQDQGTADGMGYVWTLNNGTVTGGQGTPAITFTAGTVGPLGVQVKATNLGGSATGMATVTVVAVPTAPIFAQDRAHYGNASVLASVPPQAGMTYLWTLSGAGPLSNGTTPVASYATAPATGSYQLSVDVQNLAGDQVSATRTLDGVGDAFLRDPRSGIERKDGTATILPDGRVLVAGGSDSQKASAVALLYDPYSRTWTQVGSMAFARTGHTATLLADGRVFVTGGTGDDYDMTPLASAEIYDPATRAWTTVAPMSIVRDSHAAARLADGKVLVAGGIPILTDTNNLFLDSAEIYDPATDSWTGTGSLSSRRANPTATLLPSGKVLLVGGQTREGTIGITDTTDLFDPATLTWTAGPRMAGSRGGHSANLLANGKVLVAGGLGSAPSTSATLFDPAANGGAGAWSATANAMSVGRYNHQSVALPGGKVLVISGSDGVTSGKVVTSAEVYDPATNTWAGAGNLAFARTHHMAALLPDGKVITFGGLGANSIAGLHLAAEVYDPALNIWSNAGGMATSRRGHTTTTLLDGTLLVTGGDSPTSSLGITESVDPATGDWSSVGSLASPRQMHGTALLADGRVLAVGGWSSAGFLASAERYSPASKTWAAAASLSVGRREHTVTRLADGKVLVAGGVDATYAALATAEVYDPASDTWSPAGPMGQARYEHTATLLSNGKVLVAGGRAGSAFPTSAELYDPATNTWSPVAPMNAGREFHRATLLAGDKVLVTGGQINGSIFTASMELYDAAANTWTAMAPMSAARGAHAALLLPGNQVLVIGGFGGPYGPGLTSAERYDPATDTWTPVASLVAPRKNHTATSFGSGGAVLIIGGDPNSACEIWKP